MAATNMLWQIPVRVSTRTLALQERRANEAYPRMVGGSFISIGSTTGAANPIRGKLPLLRVELGDQRATLRNFEAFGDLVMAT